LIQLLNEMNIKHNFQGTMELNEDLHVICDGIRIVIGHGRID